MAISAVAVTVQIRAASRAVSRAGGVSFADKFSGAWYVTSVTDGDGTVEACRTQRLVLLGGAVGWTVLGGDHAVAGPG